VARGLEGLRVRQRLCLAMGVFDGVHLGHQAIIAETVKMAAQSGVPAVLTFDPHPSAVLSKRGAPRLLTTTEEKIALLRALGVKLVIVADFTRAFAGIPPRDFIERLVAQQLKACCVVVGEGWRFGAAGRGNAEMLHRAAPRCGFQVKLVPAVEVNGKKVSSTRIRELLLRGRVAAARQYLGRAYQLSGVVVRGDSRGRVLGFPTANLKTPAEKLIPADGVYVCYAGQRRWRPAIASIGVRPTFETKGERRVEVHLLGRPFGFAQGTPARANLLGRRLRVALLERLRGERAFASPEALVAQMLADRTAAWGKLLVASGDQALQPPGDVL
jgi:riboflavin kinase/FMN adenylyltransferase